MLTIAKLTQGQEAYYERSVAQGLDDYYAGRGESPGVWAGRGAWQLGLDGVVGDGQLGQLCKGRDPGTGDRLRRRARQRTITVERIDPYSGTSRLESKKLAPVCGYDLVFSAPKSVSLLHALGDRDIRHQVNQSHLAAWQAAISYLEDEACVVRKGRNGVEREHAEGFVAAAYQHRTSRAEDPQLHTHVIAANMARTPSDGKWRALDGEALLRTYRLAGGYLYQAHLRHELSTRLGVGWHDTVKGMAEISGVPTGVLQEFSRRRLQVEQHMEKEHTSGYYAALVAALATRDRKQDIDMPRAISEWKDRAAEHGLGEAELAAMLGRTAETEPSGADLLAIATRLASPAGLTEKRTVFSEPELVMAWAEAARQGLAADKLRRISERFLTLDTIRRVTSTGGAGRPARYSTRELISTEQAALALVEAGIGIGAPAANLDPEQEARRGVQLSAQQLDVASHATASTNRVVCVVGRAGAGKTTTMQAVTDTFNTAGTHVIGAAPSAVAARKLHDGTGILTLTLHRLNRREQLPHRCVLLVDEVSMADTRTLARTLHLVDQADGKAILVGDPHQLPAVGAGGLFAAIVDRHGALELTQNRRQRDELERHVLQRLRHGMGREYLAHAQRTERLVGAGDSVSARAQLLVDWWQHAKHDPAQNVMIALRRRDVHELNQLAHRFMETDGRLGLERLHLHDTELAVGDRVVCKRNNTAIGVTNGTQATIRRVDPARREIGIEADTGEQLTLPRAYLDAGNLRHAYALTGHATQGLTVDRAFVLATGDSHLQEWGYVAFSRARTETRLYVTGGTTVGRETHAPTDPAPEPVTRLAQALEESQREHLAIDQAPHAHGPRHDTAPIVDRPLRDEIARERLRLVDRERLAIEKTRALAERALDQAERGHASCGLFGGGRRARLDTEIRVRCEALRRATSRLAAIDHQKKMLLANQSSAATPELSTPEAQRYVEHARSLGLGR